MPKRLSKPRTKLLARLAVKGSLEGARMSIPARSLGSRMQSDGLVRWQQPPFGVPYQRDLSRWTLHITDAGRVALKEEGGND